MASLFGYTSTAEYEIAKQTAKQVAENMAELLREVKDELKKEKSSSKALRSEVRELKKYTAKYIKANSDLERNIQTEQEDHACTKGLLAFSKNETKKAAAAVNSFVREGYSVDDPTRLVKDCPKNHSTWIIQWVKYMRSANLLDRLNDTSVALNEAKEANKVIAAEKKALSQELDEAKTELKEERENFVVLLRRAKEKNDALERDLTDAKARDKVMMNLLETAQKQTKEAQDQSKRVQTGAMVMDWMNKKRKFNPALTDGSDE